MSKYPSLVCLLIGGPPIRMDAGGDVVTFEWHEYLGPMPITMRRGKEGCGRNLPPNHPFWRKVTRWCEQGRVVENGWAVVKSEKELGLEPAKGDE